MRPVTSDPDLVATWRGWRGTSSYWWLHLPVFFHVLPKNKSLLTGHWLSLIEIVKIIIYPHALRKWTLKTCNCICRDNTEIAQFRTRGIFIRDTAYIPLWFDEAYGHTSLNHYALSRMKIPHVRDCAISALSLNQPTTNYQYQHRLFFVISYYY